MSPRRVALIVVLGALALPAAAGADAISTVENAYRTHGTIAACQFSAATLSAALKEEPTYDAEYNADLTDTIQAALNAAAGGRCDRSRTTAGTSAASSLPNRPGGGAGVPRATTGATGSGLPAPIAILAGLAALLALGAAVSTVGRLGGYEPLWLADWRHAWAEAGHRLALSWAELADRARGRAGG